MGGIIFKNSAEIIINICKRIEKKEEEDDDEVSLILFLLVIS